jgi:hypothetical protein
MLKSIVRFCLLSALSSGLAQTAVNVNVNLNRKVGTYTPIFSWFGYDESNYSTTERGQALLHELHDLSPVPVYIRDHFLLASGDGEPELKWSSSNVYTEDANGNPVYNWTILDRIFDAYAAAHVCPMVELGFMPKALSGHPDPYHTRMASEERRSGGVVVSAQGLQTVGGTDSSGGRAYGEALRHRDRFHVVLGSMERAQRRVLLEGNARRIQQAV